MHPIELDYLRSEARKASLVVEIGCWHGRSTFALAEGCPGRVIAIDHFGGSLGDRAPELAHALSQGTGDIARNAFRHNLSAFLESGKVILLESESVIAAKKLGSLGFLGFAKTLPDFIFIDGAHHYEAVSADIKAWLPLLRPGGKLAGHDRFEPGVSKAINELLPVMFKHPGWRPAAGSIWEWEKPHDYSDSDRTTEQIRQAGAA